MTDTSQQPWRSIGLADWIAICAAAALLAIGILRYHPFISDDALISLRYAKRLLAGEGLTWTAGRPVEGYSNLLWILSVSVLGLLPVKLVTATRLLGIFLTVATILVLLFPARATSHRGLQRIGLGGLFLAASGSMAAWAIGGLEQPLVALLLALAIRLTFPLLEQIEPPSGHRVAVTIVLGLLCLTRPDGFLFAAAIFAVVLGVRRRFAIALPLIAGPAVAVTGQLLFRLSYYGEWLPNPALIKIGPSTQTFTMGLGYIVNGLISVAPLGFISITALAVTIALPATRRRGTMLAVITSVWSAYVIFIGGDIFPAWRHLVPIIVCFAFALNELGFLLLDTIRGTRARIVFGSITIVLFTAFIFQQRTDSELNRAIEERWEWDGKAVGQTLKYAFRDSRPLLACTAAGCLPYWSELPSIDMLGLNDYEIARRRPESPGRRKLAHEFGDGRYVLEREPDLVFFCGPLGSMSACYRSGQEMQSEAEFRANYIPARIQTLGRREVRAVCWVRLTSDKVGIRETEDGYVIPALLFTAEDSTYAYPDISGQLVIAVTKDRPARLTLHTELPGRWGATAVGPGAEATRVEIEKNPGGTLITVGRDAPGVSQVSQVELVYTGE